MRKQQRTATNKPNNTTNNNKSTNPKHKTQHLQKQIRNTYKTKKHTQCKHNIKLLKTKLKA